MEYCEKWLWFSTCDSFFGYLLQDAFEYSKKTKQVADILDKVPFLKHAKNAADKDGSKISWYYNVTPFEQKQKNEEASNSPKYYRSREVSGGFEAGIQGTAEWPVWGIPFDQLPLPSNWIKPVKDNVKAQVVVKAKADAGGEIKVQQVSKKWVNTSNWINNKAIINPAIIRLKAEFGVEAEVSVLKDFPLFSIGATASGMTNAEILTIGMVNGNFMINYFRDGINLDTRMGGFITIAGLKYELSPFYKQFKLWENK